MTTAGIASLYITGNSLAMLVGRRPAGDHALRWDGTVDGRAGPAGVYLLRVETERSVLTRKVMLLK